MFEKIKTLGELGEIAAAARAKGRKVVLAHGVFDILHVGHKRHLDIGKRHGDLLIVTLTTDKFVNKGPDRPVFSEKLRAARTRRDEVVGSTARDRVEAEILRLAEKDETLERRISALDSREDEVYRKWRNEYHELRYRAPNVTRLFQVSFRIGKTSC